MRKFWQRRSDFSQRVAGSTRVQNCAVICQNLPSPEGLLQKYCSAALKPLKIESQFPAGFALHSSISATQRFHEINVYRVLGFMGDNNGCNEKVLEAIQMAWIEERD